MDRQTGLEITEVANGFLVRPCITQTGYAYPNHEIRVFQTFTELMLFLEQHFRWRNKEIAGDTR